MTVLLLGSFLPTQVQAQAPTITSFSPTMVCQGDVVTITGTGFTGTTVVILGTGNAASFTVNTTGTIITAVVSNSSATGTVTVANPTNTATGADPLTIKPSAIPSLTDAGNPDGPFTNCNGNATYQLTVQNGSTTYGTGNAYKIDWGDNTSAFTTADWPYGTQTTHTYNAQGYFTVTMTITPANVCTLPRRRYWLSYSAYSFDRYGRKHDLVCEPDPNE